MPQTKGYSGNLDFWLNIIPRKLALQLLQNNNVSNHPIGIPQSFCDSSPCRILYPCLDDVSSNLRSNALMPSCAKHMRIHKHYYYGKKDKPDDHRNFLGTQAKSSRHPQLRCLVSRVVGCASQADAQSVLGPHLDSQDTIVLNQTTNTPTPKLLH